MYYTTETKPQGWRALAILADRSERLLYLGRSTVQVKAGYAAAYEEVLDKDEKKQVCGISLQCWSGTPDQGHWVAKMPLDIPSAVKPTLKGSDKTSFWHGICALASSFPSPRGPLSWPLHTCPTNSMTS